MILISFKKNKDLFSPSKIFLITFLIFYLHSFLFKQSFAISSLIILVLLTNSICILKEKNYIFHVKPNIINIIDLNKIIFGIWFLSVPSIFSFLYLVKISGGLDQFMAGYGNRLLDWKGHGIAVILMSWVYVLNLLYFSIILLSRSRKIFWYYICHFILSSVFGLASGSRSTILFLFLNQLIIFHYLKKPVKPIKCFALTLGLVLAGLLLGTVREKGFSTTLDSLKTGDNFSEILNTASFSYGIKPLEVILSADSPNIACGMTFISGFTNFIPRKIWPSKLETGGVYLTKEYLDDEWDGASYMTPTFLGEWILNFGLTSGIIGFIFSSTTISLFLAKIYKSLKHQLSALKNINLVIHLNLYIATVISLTGLQIGEFTNTITNLFFAKILPIILLKNLIMYKKYN